ncbi:TMF1 family protein [Megaselia abdita]
MSWLNTSNFASLAKNALKDVQKQIDKALDIQEEDYINESQRSDEPTNVNEENMKKSPWDSEIAFFETPPNTEMITTPPKISTNEVSTLTSEVPSKEEADETAEEKVVVPEEKSSAATVISDSSTQSFENIQMNDCPINLPETSSQNSNDDTATSSDIEIISNPNGDSSSTQSFVRKRQSLPNTNILVGGTPKRGHARESSEVSTLSEDSQCEIEKLLHRISEINGVLEARELQLVQLNRENANLHDKNLEIQSLLDMANEKSEDAGDVQKVSALERKFQTSIRERDSLKTQIASLRTEMDQRVPKENLIKITEEKDQVIDELRIEGEKLAKQVLQHSNILKKLRSKEKESDQTLKKNKDQIDLLTEEVERLKKSLSAKEEVERTQIEAVHKLCTEKKRLEKSNQTLSSQNEDLTSKLETLQLSFDALKKELQQRQDSHIELTRKTEILSNVNKEKQRAETQNRETMDELRELREKLKTYEAGITQREQVLRQENTELMKRLELADLRSEELTQEVSSATMPLMRQLENLEATLNNRTMNWQKQEKELVDELESTQKQLQSLENLKQTSSEEISSLNVKLRSLEEKLSATNLRMEQSRGQSQQLEVDFNLREMELKRNLDKLNDNYINTQKNNEKLQEKISKLEEDLDNEKRKKVAEFETVAVGTSMVLGGGRDSPTFSVDRHSITESLESSAWQLEDLDSSSVKQQSVYGGFNPWNSSHSASTVEHLQSLLKQKDGELCQLQWESSRLQSERNVLNSEISKLTLELEQIKDKVIACDAMETEFTELKTNYDALLQMYGEKVEQYEELKLDLTDVKDMYKLQIDELLRQGYKV